jgi:exopolyphosphatase/guanosine-5'-triphosphate,3'-diphosphate pyrophosphatase
MIAADGSEEIRDGDIIAGADLGSNSFHLIVARYERGEIRVIDRLRETVRLAAGLRSDGTLSREHREIAFACLAQFGQRISGLRPSHVRAVATNAVRRLAHPQAFLLPAETALGHPIEVVSGREEARLIYQGVAHGLPLSDNKRLVVDIGGGSTEFIIGRGFDALERESLQVGCIVSTKRFFDDGKLTIDRWRQAVSEISIELQQFGAHYRERGWSEAIGSSGTAKAIGSVIVANGWSDQGITSAALRNMREALLDAGHVDAIHLDGLPKDRVGIIAGGMVIMEALFKTLDLERMSVCDTAMREGLLYDLLGRATQKDPRHTSIEALADRYGVDQAQAQRIRATADALFSQVAASWNLEPVARDFLDWSAHVHEIGLAIAHSQYHIHGAYIIANSDLAGFTRQGQQLLATIVRSHRRRPNAESLRNLPQRMQPNAQRVTALLRLAILLHRSRADVQLPPLRLSASGESLTLELPRTWLEQHPLTRVDLEQERESLKQIDITLQVVKVDSAALVSPVS